jgi:hypothetical protein
VARAELAVDDARALRDVPLRPDPAQSPAAAVFDVRPDLASAPHD